MTLLACSCERAATTDRPLAPASHPSAAPSLAPGPIEFVDITERSGVRFVHTHGMQGEKLLPETLGAGCGLFDFDGDGHLDLFLVNSRAWSGDTPAVTSALYRGDGRGGFQDVTAATGAGVHAYGMGCAMADVDGDGHEDVLVTALDGQVFLRNRGGTFVDETVAAGLTARTWIDPEGRAVPEWSTAAAWFDADGDGDLDLFVASYCKWTPALEIFTTMDGVTKAFTTPDRYEGLPCRLFFNDGTGRFAEGPARADLEPHLGKALGVAVWDFDGDGRLDVAVANDTRPNFLFLNQGGGRFREAALETGIAYDLHGRARAGMGIDIADLLGDGRPAVAIGNFAGEPLSLYRWRPPAPGGTGNFEEIAERSGVARATHATLAFGVLFVDANLDGHLDLFVVNGHIEPDIARFAAGQSYAQRAHAFLGTGADFTEVTSTAGPPFAEPLVARGLVAGDLDGDGDLDLVITTSGGAPRILQNRARDRADPPAFLRVRLRGPRLNPMAIGARLTLERAGQRQVRLVKTGSSYASQSDPTVTFGLGTALPGTALPGTLTIDWPDGRTSRHAIAADHTGELTIDEP